MNSLEAVTVARSKVGIEFDLGGFQVSVVGSQMCEDGWLLMLEGDDSELNEIIEYWRENGNLVEN